MVIPRCARDDMLLYGKGGRRSGDPGKVLIYNSITDPDRRFFSPVDPYRKCHSELIHQVHLQNLYAVWWINEESSILYDKA